MITLPKKKYDFRIDLLIKSRSLAITFYSVPKKAVYDVLELKSRNIRIDGRTLPLVVSDAAELLNCELQIFGSGYDLKELAESILQHLQKEYELTGIIENNSATID